MQIKIFTIPAFAEMDQSEDLNRFLRANRILEIRKEFVNGDNGAFWSICVTYLPTPAGIGAAGLPSVSPRKEKPDYKNLLSDTDFQRFTVLRKLRKQIADADAVPPYAVFTDAELSEVAKLPVLNHAGMIKIDGIGPKKIEKYGMAICEMYDEYIKNNGNETDRASYGEDMQS